MSTSAKYAELGQPDDRATAEWIRDLVEARQEAERLVESLEQQIHEPGGFIDRLVDAEAEVERLREQVSRG